MVPQLSYFVNYTYVCFYFRGRNKRTKNIHLLLRESNIIKTIAVYQAYIKLIFSIKISSS